MKRSAAEAISSPTPSTTTSVPTRPSRPARRRIPSRGNRFSPAAKAEILQLIGEGKIEEVDARYHVSDNTIARWQAERDRRPTAAPTSKAETASEAPPPDDEARRKRALSIWNEHRGYGPSQVRNILRREGIKASVTTVRAIMEEAGYVAPKHRPKEHTGSYEAARPRELYHLDFNHFFVHKQKQCLLFIEDDFSRFIVGWALVESESAAPVISAFERAVERYGKPEAVMSDRGSAFHSWRGLSRFQALLEEYSVDFILSREPQVNGKVEALNAAFQKECQHCHEFQDLTDAARVIARWVDTYNHQRTHHGLGGLLVPADRFYGLAERTLKMIEAGQGGHALDILNPDHRGLELFRVVSHGGQPEIYLMGKKIL